MKKPSPQTAYPIDWRVNQDFIWVPGKRTAPRQFRESVIDTRAVAGAETYERPAIAGSGAIACGLAACASSVSKTLLLARSDTSAWRAEEEAHALCAKVDGGDPGRIKVTTEPGD